MVRSVACMVFIGVTLALTTICRAAGKYNEVLQIGAPAPAWNDLPGIDNKTHSLNDLKDKELLVVVFTCNSCPVAVGYEDRIIALAKKYAGPDGKVAVVAINVNKIEADRLPKMQERAKEKGFNFTYLYDDSQKIARDYGARYTPEFFVLDRARKVAYMGALDDKSDAKSAKVNYVEAALDALLRGERPALAETRARGCAVRYARETN
jgi:peroxiredoxin